MKAFVIGDIHGCLNQLKELVKDIDCNETQIFSVGDLIDRGPYSEEVIDFVRNNNISCVLGNHELMAIECLSKLKEYSVESDKHVLYSLYESDWFYNGGHDVLKQYEKNSSISKLISDIEWLETLPLYIETGIKDEYGLELLVSHTYISQKNLEESKKFKFDTVWDRSQANNGRKNRSRYYNIHGHTPVDYVNKKKYHQIPKQTIPEPEWYDGVANIDTGAPYDSHGRGWLTGVFFPSLEVLQVKGEFGESNTN